MGSSCQSTGCWTGAGHRLHVHAGAVLQGPGPMAADPARAPGAGALPGDSGSLSLWLSHGFLGSHKGHHPSAIEPPETSSLSQVSCDEGHGCPTPHRVKGLGRQGAGEGGDQLASPLSWSRAARRDTSQPRPHTLRSRRRTADARSGRSGHSPRPALLMGHREPASSPGLSAEPSALSGWLSRLPDPTQHQHPAWGT